jgi:hypothetical protein
MVVNPQPRDGTKTLHEDEVVAHTALIVIAGQENTVCMQHHDHGFLSLPLLSAGKCPLIRLNGTRPTL